MFQERTSFYQVFKEETRQKLSADKNAHMWPVKPTKDMQSNRPSVPIQMSKQQIMPQEDDKNCQGNQNINMWPVKPEMDMWLPKPAITR